VIAAFRLLTEAEQSALDIHKIRNLQSSIRNRF
jgi:hypothetical protein